MNVLFFRFSFFEIIITHPYIFIVSLVMLIFISDLYRYLSRRTEVAGPASNLFASVNIELNKRMYNICTLYMLRESTRYITKEKIIYNEYSWDLSTYIKASKNCVTNFKFIWVYFFFL